jgi:flagellar biosynthesis chaperone FliJ
MQTRREILLDELFASVKNSKDKLKQGLNQYGNNPESLNQQIQSNNQQEESLRSEIEQFKKNMGGYDISSFNNQMQNYEQRIKHFQDSTASLKKQIKEYDENIKKIDEIDKDMERLAESRDKPSDEFMKEVGVFYKKYRNLCANSTGMYVCSTDGVFKNLINESQQEEIIENLQNGSKFYGKMMSEFNMERSSESKDYAAGGDMQKTLILLGMALLACIFYKRRKSHMKDAHCQKDNGDEEKPILAKKDEEMQEMGWNSFVSKDNSREMER